MIKPVLNLKKEKLFSLKRSRGIRTDPEVGACRIRSDLPPRLSAVLLFFVVHSNDVIVARQPCEQNRIPPCREGGPLNSDCHHTDTYRADSSTFRSITNRWSSPCMNVTDTFLQPPDEEINHIKEKRCGTRCFYRCLFCTGPVLVPAPVSSVVDSPNPNQP